MKFKQNASVATADGLEVGRIDRVVIDPETKTVTHVVVRKGFLFADDRVVPVEWVAEATEDHVRLREDAGDLPNLPKFEESHYTKVSDEGEQSGGYAASLYGYPPIAGAMSYAEVGHSGPKYVSRLEQNIPEGTVALREGARVITNDGKLAGHVEEILTDVKTEKATHILISKGLMTKERKLVPTYWVRGISEDEIHLAIPADLLEKLRPYGN